MSQFALKFIAMVAMLLDHTSKVVLNHGVLMPILGMELNNLICTSMVVIGRISFPMFAWFTAEGCRKSLRPGKYLGRLAIFAVLSEIPFQLCFLNRIEFGCNNVIFTLLLAAVGIYACTTSSPEIYSGQYYKNMYCSCCHFTWLVFAYRLQCMGRCPCNCAVLHAD